MLYTINQYNRYVLDTSYIFKNHKHRSSPYLLHNDPKATTGASAAQSQFPAESGQRASSAAQWDQVMERSG